MGLAIASIFCSFILAPIAISKAVKAEKLIAENPHLKGKEKAKAAKIIAIISLLIWSIALLSILAQLLIS